MNDDAFDGWNGASLTIAVDGVANNYTIPFGGQSIANIPVNAGDVIALNYAPGTWESEVSYILYDDQGNVIFEDGPNPDVGMVWTGNATCGGSGGMVWSWSPVEGLSDANIPNPMVYVTSQTLFTATAYVAGHPICVAMDSVTVTLDPGLDPGLDSRGRGLCNAAIVPDDRYAWWNPIGRRRMDRCERSACSRGLRSGR